jgi:hypothetical protein
VRDDTNLTVSKVRSDAETIRQELNTARASEARLLSKGMTGRDDLRDMAVAALDLAISRMEKRLSRGFQFFLVLTHDVVEEARNGVGTFCGGQTDTDRGTDVAKEPDSSLRESKYVAIERQWGRAYLAYALLAPFGDDPGGTHALGLLKQVREARERIANGWKYSDADEAQSVRVGGVDYDILTVQLATQRVDTIFLEANQMRDVFDVFAQIRTAASAALTERAAQR